MKRATILIVDDEQDLLDMMVDILSTNFHCVTAQNPFEAFEKIKLHKPQLIVTDFNMPGMNGLEFLKTLSEKKLHVPSLMLTGRGSRPLHQQTLALGLFEYLEKPFYPSALVSSIEKALLFALPNPDEKTEGAAAAFQRVLGQKLNSSLPAPTMRALEKAALSQGLSISTYLTRHLNEFFALSDEDSQASDPFKKAG